MLIPAAENAISGRAFRPGDVLKSRKGLTVEIGNTDAEGRLVLADALALADEEAPELLVSMATLTGAARVALGPELPPFYTDDADFAAALEAAAAEVHDPHLAHAAVEALRQLALLQDRRPQPHIEQRLCRLDRRGAVPPPLRRRRDDLRPFRHLRLEPAARPIGPEGGEAQAIRALFRYLSKRYG